MSSLVYSIPLCFNTISSICYSLPGRSLILFSCTYVSTINILVFIVYKYCPYALIIVYAILNYKSIGVQYNIYPYLKKGGYFKMNEKTTLTIRIDRQLLKEMKIIALQQDTSVTRIVIDYFEKYVEENKK